MTPRYVYFAAFQPGFIKIGSSIRPNKAVSDWVAEEVLILCDQGTLFA